MTIEITLEEDEYGWVAHYVVTHDDYLNEEEAKEYFRKLQGEKPEFVRWYIDGEG